MTIDFYYSVASPPCRSVLLLAKALGVELNLKRTSVRNNETKTPEFLKLNPQHCIPTLVDNGFSIWESRAILGYLANKYAKDDSIYPKDPQKRATVDQRLYFDIGTLFPRLREYLMTLRSGNTPSAEIIAKLEEAFQLLDKFLEGQDWVAGNNITIADYSLVVSASLTDAVFRCWYCRIFSMIWSFLIFSMACVAGVDMVVVERVGYTIEQTHYSTIYTYNHNPSIQPSPVTTPTRARQSHKEYKDRLVRAEDANIPAAKHVSVKKVLEYDIGKFNNVTKWLSRAKKTILGYQEVQDEGNAELRKMFPSK